MNAAIWCVAVCVCDITNNEGMCGRSVHYVIRQLFLLFIGKEQTRMHHEELQFEAKTYFCCTNIDRTTLQSLQMEI